MLLFWKCLILKSFPNFRIFWVVKPSLWVGTAPWWWLHQGFRHWTLCKQQSPGNLLWSWWWWHWWWHCGIDDLDDVDDNDDDDDTDDTDVDTGIDDICDDTDDDTDGFDDTNDADLLFREVALDTEHFHNVPAIALVKFAGTLKSDVQFYVIILTYHFYRDSVFSSLLSFLFRNKYIPS